MQSYMGTDHARFENACNILSLDSLHSVTMAETPEEKAL
jgi:hypothetical protein